MARNKSPQTFEKRKREREKRMKREEKMWRRLERKAEKRLAKELDEGEGGAPVVERNAEGEIEMPEPKPSPRDDHEEE